MSNHIANVDLDARKNTFPGMPDCEMYGALYVDRDTLVFNAGGYSLGMPVLQIKKCYVNRIETGFLFPLITWFVVVTYYDANFDMPMTVSFRTGIGRAIFCEGRATRIAKSIWDYYADAIARLRDKTTVIYREG